MFRKSKVLFKGKGSGLIVTLDEEASYEEIKKELTEKVKRSRSFFNGASGDIVFEGKKLTDEQENEITDIIVNNSGLDVGFVNFESENVVSKPPTFVPMPEGPRPLLKRADDYSKFRIPASDDEIRALNSASNGSIDEKVLIYHGFVRSGKLIEAEENVVIIGGINPGGEVFAGKNIIVFGLLKGKAVAGRRGFKDSFIAAVLFEPELLGIESYVLRFPNVKKEKIDRGPSIARLENGKIIVTHIGK